MSPLIGGSQLICAVYWEQASKLEEYKTRLTVFGIANSRHMLLAASGTPLSLATWQEDLLHKARFSGRLFAAIMSHSERLTATHCEQGERTDLTAFHSRISTQRNGVIVDCTASSDVPDAYSQ